VGSHYWCLTKYVSQPRLVLSVHPLHLARQGEGPLGQWRPLGYGRWQHPRSHEGRRALESWSSPRSLFHPRFALQCPLGATPYRSRHRSRILRRRLPTFTIRAGPSPAGATPVETSTCWKCNMIMSEQAVRPPLTPPSTEEIQFVRFLQCAAPDVQSSLAETQSHLIISCYALLITESSEFLSHQSGPPTVLNYAGPM